MKLSARPWLASTRRVVDQRVALLRLLGVAGRRPLSGFVLALVLTSALPAATAVSIGWLVGDVASGGDPRSFVPIIALFATLLFADQATQALLVPYRDWMASRVNGAIRSRVRKAVTGRVGVDHLQDQAIRDAATLPVDNAYLFNLGAGAEGQAWLLARFWSAFLATCVVALASAPGAAVLLGAIALQRAILRRHYAGAIATAAVDTVSDGRASGYWGDLAASSHAAKEIRVFDLGCWMIDRFRRHGQVPVDALGSVIERAMPLHAKVFVLNAIGVLVALALVARAGLNGTISVGLLAAAIGSTVGVARILGPMGWEAYSIDAAVPLLDAVERLERFAADRAPVTDEARPVRRGAQPPLVQFDNVSFRYPNGDRQVFDGLNLELRPGESVAIVGENGVGKSTLLRLLARFYEPTSGRILVDGEDLRDLDPVWWRQHLALIFQGFTRLELSALENVGFTDVGAGPDPDRAALAASLAGALPVIEGLPARWDTVLSRDYRDGVELSGGQWQRVALARALYSALGGANILMLDEPTAALDVRAEATIFDALLDAASGRTTIIVSHRFSTVRRAGRIVVLGRDGPIEDGTHDELCSRGGTYASLFALQASRFREELPAGGLDGRSAP